MKDIKLCPFRKDTSTLGNGTVETFLECLGSRCMAWSESDNICSICSDKRTFNVEARVDTRYNL